MKKAWLGLALLAVPLCVWTFAGLAQQGSVLRESEPADQPAPADLPPDNSVTASPLPPPDQDMQPEEGADAQPEMVPNPLGPAPGGAPAPAQAPGSRKVAQPEGQPQRGGWVQMGSATLQALDKVDAHSDTVVVKVGDTGHFGSLDISVRGCFVRTPDRPTDATAFLVIRDQHAATPVFSGWMVRSAPYMSMLANPIYDVRIAGCTS